MKTIENKTSQNIENNVKNEVENIRKQIADESRYAVIRKRRLEKKIIEQEGKNSLLMYQVTNRMRLDGLNGAVDTDDAKNILIRICNGIDKNRYPQLKQILDNYQINVATLKNYIRLSSAGDYNKFLTKTGQIDYTRVIGRICQNISRERKQSAEARKGTK